MRKFTVFLTWPDRDCGTAMWWMQVKAPSAAEAELRAVTYAVADFNKSEGEGAYDADDFEVEVTVCGWPKFDFGGRDPS